MWKVIRDNPRAVVYAVLTHLVLLILLVVSLDWTPKITRQQAGVPIQAELVDHKRLEAIEQQKQAEQRRAEDVKRKAETERKRKLEQDIKRKAAEAAERKAAAERKRKAALEAKRKAELKVREKAAAESKRKAELQAKEKAALEAKRKAELQAKEQAAAERKRKAVEATRQHEAEQALKAQLAEEQARQQAEHEQRAQGVVAEYTAYIQEKVERNWLRPPGSPEGLSCVVKVSLIPGGDVARVEIIQGSGNPVFDRSVEAAVFRAAPLPMPQDAALFSYFRELRLVFKPR